MPEQPIWPPAPETPVAQSEHDRFLIAILRTAPPSELITRDLLQNVLSYETGLGRVICRMRVADFCDRHDIFPIPIGLNRLLTYVPILVVLVLVAGDPVLIDLEGIQHAAPTVAANRTAGNQLEIASSAYVIGFVLTALFTIIVGLVNRRRKWRESNEARMRVTSAYSTDDGFSNEIT